MPAPVGYQSFCPVGAALNVVGERWSLLIVRDLLLGPRRYSELLSGLGGIGTDILAARLRTLQEHGVVEPVGRGRARYYQLTEAGRALQPVLSEFARWGAPRLQVPSDLSEIPPRVPLTSLLLGVEAYPRQASGVFEIRVDSEVVCVAIEGGRLRPTPTADPTVTIELTRAGLRALVVGAPASVIEERGDVSLKGGRRRAYALLNALSGPPLLKELRRDLPAAG